MNCSPSLYLGGTMNIFKPILSFVIDASAIVALGVFSVGVFDVLIHAHRIVHPPVFWGLAAVIYVLVGRTFFDSGAGRDFENWLSHTRHN